MLRVKLSNGTLFAKRCSKDWNRRFACKCTGYRTQLPQVGSETNSEFKKLLERLIKTDTPSNEKEISCKVFKLYDLSLDEQSYIETNFT